MNLQWARSPKGKYHAAVGKGRTWPSRVLCGADKIGGEGTWGVWRAFPGKNTCKHCLRILESKPLPDLVEISA